MDIKSIDLEQGFMLAKLNNEYRVLEYSHQLLDKAMSQLLTGVSILITVLGITLTSGLLNVGSLFPTDQIIVLGLVGLLFGIASVYGSIFHARLLNQRSVLVATLKKIRTLERYFTFRYPDTELYLLEHTPERLQHRFLIDQYFSPYALRLLKLFSVCNSIFIGVAFTLGMYILLSGLNVLEIALYSITLVIGAIAFISLFVFQARQTNKITASVEGTGNSEYERVQRVIEGVEKRPLNDSDNISFKAGYR